jgi:protein O-mannosyl-transferase
MSKNKSKLSNQPIIIESIPKTASKFHRIIGFGLAIFSILIYGNTIGHGYVLDDPLSIGLNSLVTQGISAWPEIFFSHYRAGTEAATASSLQYRPLSLLSFALEWSISPNNPKINHIFQVLYFGCTIAITYFALRRLLAGHIHWLAPICIVLLYASHPIHTEVVANIKSRDEIFVMLFGMLSLYFFLKYNSQQGELKYLIISLLCAFLALISKENAILLLPIYGLGAWFFYRKNLKQSILINLPYLIPAILFFVCQQIAFKSVNSNLEISVLDNPIMAATSFSEKSATGFLVLWQYLQLLFWPNPLLSDYSYNHIQLVNWSNISAILGIIAYFLLIIYTIWATLKRKPIGFFLALFLIGMVLYSQLLIKIGTLFGERLVFTPSIWWCGIVVSLAIGIFKFENKEEPSFGKSEKLFLVIVSLITALFSGITISRNSDWKNNLTLFKADALKSQKSIRLLNGYASELYIDWQKRSEEFPETEKLERFNTIIAISNQANNIKENTISYLNLGNVAMAKNDFEGSIKYYESSLSYTPDYSLAKQNLCKSLVFMATKEGRENQNLSKAEILLRKAIGYNESSEDANMNLGTVLAMQGKAFEAIPFFEKTAIINPENTNAWKNLGMAYKSIGNIEKANFALSKVQ